MSRRLTILGICLACVAAIVVGYFLLSRHAKPPETVEAKTPETVAAKPPVEKVIREWTIPGVDSRAKIMFSPTGRYVAYASTQTSPRMIYNDWRSQECDTLAGGPYVSPDCEHVAFVLSRGGKKILVTDGVEGTPCADIDVQSQDMGDKHRSVYRYPALNGQFAYVKQDDEKGPRRVVFGGKEGPGYDEIKNFIFSPDGKHFACGVLHGGRVFYVVDGKELPPFRSVPDGGFKARFSPDGQRCARVEDRNGESVVVCDGEESRRYQFIADIEFSPDGRRLAFVAEHRGKHYVIADGGEGPEADSIESPSFSPDSRHVAWCSRQGSDSLLVVDKKPQTECVARCRYVADGKLYRLAKEGNEWFHVWGNERFAAGKQTNWIAATSPYFSPNGRHIAYWLPNGENKASLMLDGRLARNLRGMVYNAWWSRDGEHLLYEESYVGCDDRLASVGNVQSDPVFSPDGRHAAYVVNKGRSPFVCCDGYRLPEHLIIGELTASDKLRYGAVEKGGRTARWIEVEWPAGTTWKDGFLNPEEAASVGQVPQTTPGPSPAAPATSAADRSFAEKAIREWRIPKEDRPRNVTFSPSGSFMTYSVTGEKDALVFDDKRLAGYDEVIGPFARYDGDHVAWRATRGGKQMMIIDGVEGKAYKTVREVWTMSEGRSSKGWMVRAAYAAREEGASGWRLVRRGTESAEYDYLLGVRISADASHMALFAVRGKQVVVVCDGKELPGFDAFPVAPDSRDPDGPFRNPGYGLGTASFSPDGSRFAYVSRRGKKQFVRCDGKDGPEYDWVSDVRFSPDGKSLAYVAMSRRKCLAVIHGEAAPRAEADSISMLGFSPDSRHTAWLAGNADRKCLFLDGKQLGEDVRLYEFSPDGRLAWTVAEGEKTFLVWEGNRLLLPAQYSPPTFTPSGRHMYVIGDDAEWKRHVVVDGRPLERATEILGWSPDEEHLLYLAAEPQGALSALWCDGRKASVGTSHRFAVFSPDGRHAAYVVLGDGVERVSCDGLAGPPHEQVVSLIPGDRLRYITWDENRTVARLIETEWPSGHTWTEGFTEPQK